MRTFQTRLSDTSRNVLLGAIRIYQLTLSPIIGPCCRYAPSCSHYGHEAIGRFGALRGGWLTLHPATDRGGAEGRGEKAVNLMVTVAVVEKEV